MTEEGKADAYSEEWAPKQDAFDVFDFKETVWMLRCQFTLTETALRLVKEHFRLLEEGRERLKKNYRSNGK